MSSTRLTLPRYPRGSTDPLAYTKYYLGYQPRGRLSELPDIEIIESPSPKNDDVLIVEVGDEHELRYVMVTMYPHLRGWDWRVVDPLRDCPLQWLSVRDWTCHIADWARDHYGDVEAFLDAIDPNILEEITRSNNLLYNGWKSERPEPRPEPRLPGTSFGQVVAGQKPPRALTEDEWDGPPPHSWIRRVYAEQGIYRGILELAVGMGFTHEDLPTQNPDHPEFVITEYGSWRAMRIPVR